MHKLFLLVFFLSLTTGCATTCDPTQGGLLGGFKLATTDCGKERLNSKNQELETVKSENQSLVAQNAALGAKKLITRQSALDLEIEVEQLDRNAKNLEAKIDDYKAATIKARNQKAFIQRKVKSLKGKISKTKRQLSSQSLTKQQYQQKIQGLNAEIDELWKVYNALQ
ncbi:MAG: hypothetical protein VSS52_001120 [Thiotrichaceae bacterium]|nr:hypothetical protein [Thiotrichaceae bacterium]